MVGRRSKESSSSPSSNSKKSKHNKPPKMETLQQLLRRAIKEGAPLYNQGDRQGCCAMYLEAAEYGVEYVEKNTFVSSFLEDAIQEAYSIITKQKKYPTTTTTTDGGGDGGDDDKHFTKAAWVLRRTFDEILEIRQNTPMEKHNNNKNDGDEISTDVTGLIGTRRTSNSRASQVALTGKKKSDYVDDNFDEEWQDEQEENLTDLEKAQHLSHIYAILLTSAYSATHTHKAIHAEDVQDYPNTCLTTDIVDILVEFGLAKHRRQAFEKVHDLKDVGFLELVCETGRDGTNLYRFATNETLEAKYDEWLVKQKQSRRSVAQGSVDSIAFLALGEFLEKNDHCSDDDDDDEDELPKLAKPLSLHNLKIQQQAMDADTHDDPMLIAKGIQLAVAMAQIEPLLDIKDRKYGVTTYEKCFVGSDIVTTLVDTKKMMPSRQKATDFMNKLWKVGFIEHVTNDHEFKDKKLFYAVVPRKDLEAKMVKTDNVQTDIITENAIHERLKQFATLSVSEILNSFYGCEDVADSTRSSGSSGAGTGENCWDVVDLQIWRNNMKRWGFGRRTDQDDEMVDKLSPLALAVDPDTWKMEDQDEEWRTPWGILAQIAIFDQVPRSAFRGTADAFKWDALAIRATNYAIDQGYFETAYKSTLNRFVILLPLEHSESWEDQKKGVNLILSMLSTVAIMDEGLSDYEIVKRLEFSKRLSTAFLEHAQVVAKFKRFPHRNKAHGRGTSIEERVWLASDLVPRWAKSQQHTDGQDQRKKNLFHLPVIPLKSLTRK